MNTITRQPDPIVVTLGGSEPIVLTFTDRDGQDLSTVTVKVAFTLDPARPPADPNGWLNPVILSQNGAVLTVRIQGDVADLPIRGRYDAWVRLVDGETVIIRRFPEIVWVE